MTLSKVFALMLALTVGLTCMLSLAGAYFIFIEKPYLSYTQLPFRVLTKEVKSGEHVLMTVLRCNSDNKTRVYELSHLLVPDDRGHLRSVVLDATAASIAPGCTESISSVNVVPVGTPPGKYHVEGFAEVNGTVKTFSVGWYSETFNVVQ